jgi:CRISPR-associated protein Cmr3
MTIWLIEPRDPLIVRDGRPFDPNPGARAMSLPFPLPSTTTGGVRTRAGRNPNGMFDLSKEQIEQLKKLEVRGPLLVELTADGSDIASGKWLLPTPLDALLFAPKQQPDSRDNAILKQLVPLQLPEGAETDFNQDLNPEDANTNLDQNSYKGQELLLIGLVKPDPSKPSKAAPRYWYWNKFQDWLLDPSCLLGEVALFELGHSGPQREQRMHVSIDNERYVAKDGALFQTSGLEFTHPSKKHEDRLSQAQRLALAIVVDDHKDFKLQEGLASFGGERRIVNWRRSNSELPACLKECPEKLKTALIEKRACRVVLLTPAYFKLGYYPSWLLKLRAGITPKLRAIAIQRPQIASGWDLALKEPKPTRRLAPAGTVLFLSLEGSNDPTAISAWIKDVWMQCISDEEQARNDGFGLALLGTWSGQPELMTEGKKS